MAIDFPNSPTVGMTWPNPAVAGQPVYTWDGEKWGSGTGYGNIYIADIPPAAPVGSLWWQSSTGTLFVNYNDGNSIQWVAVAGGPADAVLYSTVQALTTLQQAQARANIGVMKKNYVINGAMQVSQENSANASAVNGYYPVDTFFNSYGTTTGVISLAQVASLTPAGSPNRIRFTVTTADAAMTTTKYYLLGTYIEGLRCADLKFGTAAAKTVTLQFGCRGPAGTYGVTIMNSAAQVRAYIAEFTIAPGEANIDVVKSVTIPGDVIGTWATDTTAGLRLWWALMCGPTYQSASNVWSTANAYATANQFNFMGTTGNVFELFDVGLYEGTVAPPFQVPDLPNELLLCQRYYYKSDSLSAYNLGGIGNAVSGSAYVGSTFSFHVRMRTVPACSFFGAWTLSNCTGPTFWINSTDNFIIYATSVAAGGVTFYGGGIIANARM